jgi:hypothetical protein
MFNQQDPVTDSGQEGKTKEKRKKKKDKKYYNSTFTLFTKFLIKTFQSNTLK